MVTSRFGGIANRSHYSGQVSTRPSSVPASPFYQKPVASYAPPNFSNILKNPLTKTPVKVQQARDVSEQKTPEILPPKTDKKLNPTSFRLVQSNGKFVLQRTSEEHAPVRSNKGKSVREPVDEEPQTASKPLEERGVVEEPKSQISSPPEAPSKAFKLVQSSNGKFVLQRVTEEPQTPSEPLLEAPEPQTPSEPLPEASEPPTPPPEAPSKAFKLVQSSNGKFVLQRVTEEPAPQPPSEPLEQVAEIPSKVGESETTPTKAEPKINTLGYKLTLRHGRYVLEKDTDTPKPSKNALKVPPSYDLQIIKRNDNSYRFVDNENHHVRELIKFKLIRYSEGFSLEPLMTSLHTLTNENYDNAIQILTNKQILFESQIYKMKIKNNKILIEK